MNILGNSDIICSEYLSEGKKFDLILTDPPYNVGKNFGNKEDKLAVDDYNEKMHKRMVMYRELLTDTGSIVSFSGCTYLHIVMSALYDAGLYFRNLNIWHYDNGSARTTRLPKQSFDPFVWFSKDDNNWTYNVDEVRVPYKSVERIKNPVYKKRADGTIYAWTPNPAGAMRSNIWDFPTLAGKLYKDERTEHPTQKPESLITELIKAFCPMVDGKLSGKILDPFHGSGTLGACCEKLNKEGHKIEWVGIEMEEKWHKVAESRTSIK